MWVFLPVYFTCANSKRQVQAFQKCKLTKWWHAARYSSGGPFLCRHDASIIPGRAPIWMKDILNKWQKNMVRVCSGTICILTWFILSVVVVDHVLNMLDEDFDVTYHGHGNAVHCWRRSSQAALWHPVAGTSNFSWNITRFPSDSSQVNGSVVIADFS